MAVVSKLDKIWFERASSFLIATDCSGEKYF